MRNEGWGGLKLITVTVTITVLAKICCKVGNDVAQRKKEEKKDKNKKRRLAARCGRNQSLALTHTQRHTPSGSCSKPPVHGTQASIHIHGAVYDRTNPGKLQVKRKKKGVAAGGFELCAACSHAVAKPVPPALARASPDRKTLSSGAATLPPSLLPSLLPSRLDLDGPQPCHATESAKQVNKRGQERIMPAQASSPSQSTSCGPFQAAASCP